MKGAAADRQAPFPVAHAAHRSWRKAGEHVAQQLREQLQAHASPQAFTAHRLGLIYLSQDMASHAQQLLALLARELPQVTDWVGSSGYSVLAIEQEYDQVPALAVMLLDIAAADYRVYSGVAPLALDGEAGFSAQTALVHSSSDQLDLPDLLQELSERTAQGQLFGAVSQARGVQIACRAEDMTRLRSGEAVGVYHAGFSGVALDGGVACLSHLAQGCTPVSLGLEVTEVQGPVLLGLQGEPALPQLLQLLDVRTSPEDGGGWQGALSQLRKTQAAIAPAGRGVARGALTEEAQVLHIVGLDPGRQGIALAAPLQAEGELFFCQQDSSVARQELMRMGATLQDALQPDFAEIRSDGSLQAFSDAAQCEDLEGAGRQIRGAIYITSKSRSEELFGSARAELQLLRHALGPVPLIGITAEAPLKDGCVHQFAGMLTVFTA